MNIQTGKQLGEKPFSGSFKDCSSNSVLNWWITLTCSLPVLLSDYDDSTCSWQTWGFVAIWLFFPFFFILFLCFRVLLFSFFSLPLCCLELTLYRACPPPSLHPPLLHCIRFFFKLSFPTLGLTTGFHQSRNWVLQLQQLPQLAQLLLFGFFDVSY